MNLTLLGHQNFTHIFCLTRMMMLLRPVQVGKCSKFNWLAQIIHSSVINFLSGGESWRLGEMME